MSRSIFKGRLISTPAENKTVVDVPYALCMENMPVSCAPEYFPNGRHFREKFLSGLDNEDWWRKRGGIMELDFVEVKLVMPCWGREVFGYFLRYASNGSEVLERMRIVNLHFFWVEVIRRGLFQSLGNGPY